MAKIETVEFNPKNLNSGNPTNQTQIINVSASVGTNGVNQYEDIIAVQALLKYALEFRVDFRGEEFPEPCGAFLGQTMHLIKKFQRYHNRKFGAKVSIDGRINPAKGGAYTPGKRKMWTIYALNSEAMERALLSGSVNYIEELCKRWSFLRPILSRKGVGTLNLELA